MHKTIWPTALGLVFAWGCASAPRANAPSPPSVAPSVGVDEGSGVPLDGSLSAYVAHALAERPELAAAAARWRADEHRIDSVDALPSPRIEYGVFLRSVETRVGPQRHRVMVRQNVPWPTKVRAGADVFRSMLAVHEQRYDAAALEVAWQVADAYWQAWEVRQLHRWHDEHAAIVESLIDSARTQVEVTQAAVADVAQVELALSRTTDMVHTAHEQFARASIDLRRAAQLEPSTKLEVADEPARPRLPSVETATLVEWASAHPNIEALRRQQEVFEQRSVAARKSSLPDLTFGADWIETGAALDPSMPESGKDPVIASIGVTVPLFTGERRAEADAALAEREAVEADVAVARRDATAAVHRVLAELRETGRRVRLYESTLIPQAETVLGSVRGAYEIGSTPIASVLLAQQELLDIRIELVRARAAHERAWAMLERVVGRPVDAEVMR